MRRGDAWGRREVVGKWRGDGKIGEIGQEKVLTRRFLMKQSLDNDKAQQQGEAYVNPWTGFADEEELEERMILWLLLG